SELLLVRRLVGCPARYFLAVRHIPLGDLVVLTGGKKLVAVRAERDAIDEGGRARERLRQLTTRHVPNQDAHVLAGACQRPSDAAERNGSKRRLMPQQRSDLLSA